jgi:hypothetical protein
VRLAAAVLAERFEDVARQGGAVVVRIRHLQTARDVLDCCRARGVKVQASCVMSRTAA